MEPFMTVIEFAGISDFIGCDQKYENSYSEVLRFIRERMTFRVYTSVRDKFYLILVFVFIIPVGLSAQKAYIQGAVSYTHLQETYNYQKVVLQAFTEVSNALVNSRKSREIRESREHLEQSARSNLDLATLQYINGVISYLDVLDAQRGYFDAQIGLNTAIRDELLATVQLYQVLGGGCS